MSFQTPEQQEEQWQPCPTGEVAGLVSNLRQRRRRQRLQRVSVAVCGLAVAGLIGIYAVPHSRLAGPRFGGISCATVERLADEYLAGRLDNATTARIKQHLQSCEHCRQYVDRHRDRPVAVRLPAPSWRPHSARPTDTLTLVAQSAR